MYPISNSVCDEGIPIFSAPPTALYCGNPYSAQSTQFSPYVSTVFQLSSAQFLPTALEIPIVSAAHEVSSLQKRNPYSVKNNFFPTVGILIGSIHAVPYSKTISYQRVSKKYLI
jgi:hypothetical protein